MNKDEPPCRNPQVQARRLHVPAQSDENAHHYTQHKNGRELVEQGCHSRKIPVLNQQSVSRAPYQETRVSFAVVTSVTVVGTDTWSRCASRLSAQVRRFAPCRDSKPGPRVCVEARRYFHARGCVAARGVTSRPAACVEARGLRWGIR